MKKLITLLLVLISLNTYSQSTKDIKEYYEEICHNTEWGGESTPKKFYEDIKIYVRGDVNDSLELELYKIIKELNDLIIPININIEKDSLESNIYLYFGNSEGFINSLNESDYLKKWRLNFIEHNWGVFWIKRRGKTIIQSKIFIDTERTKSLQQQKHLLREELTQSLGFPNDSYKYENSIFQQSWTEVTEFSEIDKQIIKLHYNEISL